MSKIPLHAKASNGHGGAFLVGLLTFPFVLSGAAQESGSDKTPATSKTPVVAVEITEETSAVSSVTAESSDPLHRETFVNSIGIEMVRIDDGEDGFWVSRNEVDQRAYLAMTKFFSEKFPKLPPMQENPSRFKDSRALPVENVKWHDAVKFCVALTEVERAARDGQHPGGSFVYSLPSVAEWLVFSKGAVPEEIKVSNEAESEEPSPSTHEVGSKGKPNDYGLNDILGNVSEWCYDSYFPTLNTDIEMVNRFPALFSYAEGARSVVGATLLSVETEVSPFIQASSITRALSKEPVTAGNLGFRVVLKWGGRRKDGAVESAPQE